MIISGALWMIRTIFSCKKNVYCPHVYLSANDHRLYDALSALLYASLTFSTRCNECKTELNEFCLSYSSSLFYSYTHTYTHVRLHMSPLDDKKSRRYLLKVSTKSLPAIEKCAFRPNKTEHPYVFICIFAV